MSQLSLFPEPPPWGNRQEVERRNRIKISVASYTYEILNQPIMDDQAYDKLASLINPRMSTGHGRLDRFFRNHYDPFTSLWVHQHPDLEGIKRIYEEYYRDKDSDLLHRGNTGEGKEGQS